MPLTDADVALILAAEKGTAYAAWTPYVCLFSADPTGAGSFTNELAVSGYARQAVTFGAVSGRQIAATSAFTFAIPAGTVVRAVGLADALTSGTLRRYMVFMAPVTADVSGFVIGSGVLIDSFQ